MVTLRWNKTIVIAAVLAAAASVNAQASGNVTRPKLKEDLSRLKIGPMRHLMDPLVADRSETSTFTREMIAVCWRPLDKINLFLIKPKAVKKPRVALFLYSFPSSTKRFLDDAYCTRLASQGIAVVGFDTALTGDRIYNRPMREWFVSEMRESIVTSVHDIQQVVNYLATRGDLDLSRVGLFGTGSGATVSLLASTVDPRIKVVDMLNPWGAWTEWMATTAQVPANERRPFQTTSFLKSIADIDPVNQFSKSKAQMRLQIVQSDPITPHDAQRKLWNAFPKSGIKVAYDDNTDFYRETSAGRLFDWISDQLKK